MGGGIMIERNVTVRVQVGRVDDFIAATVKNHKETIREPGCMQFDVFQSTNDPTEFLFEETYSDEDAFEAHKKTVHYTKWRETVSSWMEEHRAALVIE